MLDKAILYGLIKNKATDLIDSYKIEHTHEEFEVRDGEIVSKGQISDGRYLPSGDEGMMKLMDAIAEAVAEKVIEHIKAALEIKDGLVQTASLPYTNTLQGVGGGVVGPVTVFPGNISVAAGTITIPKTNFQ